MKKIIGVYKISNTLCPEGKYYIGYSCNIRSRWNNHKSTLRGGNHCNIRMQRAYEKYGSDCFDYEILQECENEDLDPETVYFINNTILHLLLLFGLMLHSFSICNFGSKFLRINCFFKKLFYPNRAFNNFIH